MSFSRLFFQASLRLGRGRATGGPIRRVLLLGGLVAAIASGRAEEAKKTVTVGTLDFFGFRTVPVATVEAHLNIKEGAAFDRAELKAAVAGLEELPGIDKATLATITSDGSGRVHVFIGVQEKGARGFAFRDAPTGEARLPAALAEIYAAFGRALGPAVRSGNSREDNSQGHSLDTDPGLRKAQEEALALVPKHVPELKHVLTSSASAQDRAAAAWLLGYAPDKKAIAAILADAVRDPDSGVRNNATRALGSIGFLAKKNPALGIRIPPDAFIEMIGSVTWTDRNKASFVLMELTASRDAELLKILRERALPELIEMARWKSTGHAMPALRILGRIAGWDEQKIGSAWNDAGRREEIIAAATALR